MKSSMEINRRVKRLNGIEHSNAPVVYWMSRDQRIRCNWALIYAQDIAVRRRQPLVVIFTLTDTFMGAALRQYSFMLSGLELIEKELKKIKIPLIVLKGKPWEEILKYTETNKTGAVITDFSPMKNSRHWKEKVARNIKTSFEEVDAHNIVPCWIASGKQEYAARTLRPKLEKLLPEFLTSFPKIKKHPYPFTGIAHENRWENLLPGLSIDKSVEKVSWIKPGEKAAEKMLKLFIERKLSGYAEERNNPCKDFQSNLSPYLHFGNISSQYAAIKVEMSDENIKSKESFIEELLVRKELAENFCYYNSSYDSFNGSPEWAKKTLGKHTNDRRMYIYTLDEFENAATHDIIWNSAQKELLATGKMHGYMRMYWAKKILEWTKSPEEAFETAVYLNDRYELDGRDPCGYAGIAWSIGGVHDRPWFERPVYGTVRYMSENGIKAKLDIAKYIEKHGNSN